MKNSNCKIIHIGHIGSSNFRLIHMYVCSIGKVASTAEACETLSGRNHLIEPENNRATTQWKLQSKLCTNIILIDYRKFHCALVVGCGAWGTYIPEELKLN